MTQFALLILSAAAIWLISGRGPWVRWGWACGLASQPLWLWETWHAEQWGMVALSVFYTWSWGRGLANHWVVRDVT